MLKLIREFQESINSARLCWSEIGIQSMAYFSRVADVSSLTVATFCRATVGRIVVTNT